MRSVPVYPEHKAVLLIVFIPMLAHAQRALASIHGFVKDSSGAVLPNVEVVVADRKTQVQMRTTTDNAGLYRVFNLPIGDYKVEFQHTGFWPYNRTALELSVSQVAEVNVTIEVGEATRVVNVDTVQPLLQTARASFEAKLTNNLVTDMPLSIQDGRTLSFFMFANMPGVEGSDYSSLINGSPGM
jgi:hypothetical protein